jgi:3-dehydroquinate synthase
MQTVKVELKREEDRTYNISVGTDLFPNIAADHSGEGKIFIICDSNVAPLYGGVLQREFMKIGRETKLMIFPAGEASKNRREKERLEDSLFTAGAARDSVLYAVGGGVTTDLVGYVAATFMRGIRFVNVPTTLLAAVDASAGGKTGIDVSFGKNLLGAFWQPQAVYIDVITFSSLSVNEVKNGLAEMVKHGVIGDSELFDMLEDQPERVSALEPELAEELVGRNCAFKASVVSQDERENNLRQILNYGHTVGHAIERLANYRLPHGEAVAIGMAVEGEIAVRLGLWQAADLKRQNNLLAAFGLPTTLPEGSDAEKIVAATSTDKKARAGHVRYVLPEAIGKMSRNSSGYAFEVEGDTVVQVLRELAG